MKKYPLIFLLVFLILVSGCKLKDSISNPPIARVGGKILREKTFRIHTEGYSETQKKNYVDNWVRHRLLLEAAGSGHLKNADKEKLKKYKEDLRIADFKQNLKKNIVVNENDILEYYTENKRDFTLHEDHYYLGIFSFDTEKEAKAAYKKQSESQSVPASRRSYRLTAQSDLQDNIINKLKNAEPGSWIYSKNTSEQFYLIHVIKRYPSGTIPDLEHLQPLIEDRIKIQEYMKLHEKKIKESKENSNVKIFKNSF